MIDDIFSLENLDSIVRREFMVTVDLRDYKLPLFLPVNYKRNVISIAESQAALDYKGIIDKICSEAEFTGKHRRFCAGVYEAFRNAHQHGNKKDPYKKINLYHQRRTDEFEIVVCDEGGILRASFAPFVLAHRQRGGCSKNFYEFDPNAVKDDENSGIGTRIIHAVSDEINYFTNNQHGLSVQMIVRK